MINKQAQTVIDILKKQYSCYKDLLTLSKRKKDIIIEGKVTELETVIKLEQSLIFNMGQLEKAREQTVDQICDQIGVRHGTLTISELGKKLEPTFKAQLEKVQEDLSGILEELKAVNDLNGQLIKQSLEYIDYTVNVITSSGTSTGSLYEDIDDRAKMHTNKKRIFDTKV